MIPFENNYKMNVSFENGKLNDCLCGLMVEFLATGSEVPGSIPGVTRFAEK
jgi:hypothetical protein